MIKEIYHIHVHLPQIRARAHIVALAGVDLVLDRLVLATHGRNEAARVVGARQLALALE